MIDHEQMEIELKELGRELDVLSHLIEKAMRSSNGFIGEAYIKLVREQQAIIEEKIERLRLDAGDDWDSFRGRVAAMVRDMLRRVNAVLPEEE